MADEINLDNLKKYEGFPYTTFIADNIRKTLEDKMLAESRMRPLTAWIKVTSGVQRIEGYQDDFVSMTGISKLSSQNQSQFSFEDIYEKTDAFRPRPGITSVDIKYKSQYGGVRIATINWQVNSLAQLNEFGPYFLTPGRSVLLEWGWLSDGDLHIFAKSEYENINPYKSRQWLVFHQKALLSNGNYDGALGIVTNFDINLRSDGGFDCSTEVMNQGGMMYGLNLVQQMEIKSKAVKGSFAGYDSNGNAVFIPRQSTQINYEQLQKDKYKRVIKQFIENKLPEILTNFTTFDAPGRSRDVHVYVDGSESKSKKTYIDSGVSKHAVVIDNSSSSNNTVGNSKVFLSWGFIEDIIVNQNLGAKYSNTPDGQIFRISSKETFPPESKSSSQTSIKTIDLIKNPEIRDQVNRSNRISLGGQDYKNFYNNRRNSYKISNHKFLRSTDLNVCFINNGDNANEKYGIRFDIPTVETTDAKINPSVGYVRHIYVNYEVVRNAFLNADTLVDALMSILNHVNSACITFWNLKLKIKETTQEMCVIDENYYDDNLLDIIKSDADEKYKKVFLFKMFGGNGFIKSNNFSTKLPNSMAMVALYGMNKDPEDATQLNTDNDSFINLWDSLHYKDYFIKTEYELPSIPGSPVETDSDSKNESEDEIDKINSAFSAEFRNTMLPQKAWKAAGENDLINAMKKLIYSTGTQNAKQQIVLPADLELVIEGTSGLKIGDLFFIDSVPDLYLKNALFQIKGLDHSISGNYWSTTIRGLLRVFDDKSNSADITGLNSTGNTIKQLQNKRWTGTPSKKVLKWIKDEMGSILAAKTQGTIYSESLLAGIIYAEAGGFIDIDKDARFNCENIKNPDGKGTSYSFFQINDKANGAYINARLKDGSWKSPTSATSLAIFILNEKKTALQEAGLSGTELLKGVVAAYNQGQGNILSLYRAGLPLDSRNPEYVSKVFRVKSDYENV